jgi:hypothetical protein
MLKLPKREVNLTALLVKVYIGARGEEEYFQTYPSIMLFPLLPIFISIMR